MSDFEENIRKWMKRMEFSEKNFLGFLNDVEKLCIREEGNRKR